MPIVMLWCERHRLQVPYEPVPRRPLPPADTLCRNCIDERLGRTEDAPQVTVVPHTGTHTVFVRPDIQDHPSMRKPWIAEAVERNLARHSRGPRPGSDEEQEAIDKSNAQREEAKLFDYSTAAERAARARRKSGRRERVRISGPRWDG